MNIQLKSNSNLLTEKQPMRQKNWVAGNWEDKTKFIASHVKM